MSTLCLHLDDYLDGRLSDAEAEQFEAHAADCAACDAALTLPDHVAAGLRDLADEACPPALLAAALDAKDEVSADEVPASFARAFEQMRDTTCPPQVIEAALRTARRAPDRPAQAPHRRVRVGVWALGLAAALAVALGVSLRVGADEPPTRVAVARPAPVPADVTPGPVAPTPDPDLAFDPQPVPGPQSLTFTAPDVTRRRTPPARREKAPAPEASSVAGDPVALARPTDSDVGLTRDGPATPLGDLAAADPAAAPESEPTADQIEGARRDLALAFRLVAQAQTQARDALRDEAGALSSTIDLTLLF